MKALLIATVRAGIEREFGPDAYPAVADRLEQLLDRLAARAIEGHVAVLDDPVQLALAGLDALSSVSSGGTVRAVRAYAQRQDCDAVLLVGGHRILPMVEVLNPAVTPGYDPDRVVPTDLPYGADDDTPAAYVQCRRIVSRLPSPRSGELDDLLALIDVVGRAEPAKSGGTAVVSREWQEAGARVAARIPGSVRIRVAPHYELDETHRDDLVCRWLYVNLHGRPDHDEWQAFDESGPDFVKVMDPTSFSYPELAGSSMYCENCYGLKPLWNRSGETCIDAAFRHGLRSVVGATGLAYGAYLTRGQGGDPGFLENADFLASAFFDGVSEALGAGDAFREARDRLVARSGGLLNRYQLKTLLQFQLLGDPTA